MPDLSLQGLAAFSQVPSQLAANFYAPAMNAQGLQAAQLQNARSAALLPYTAPMAGAQLAGQQSQNEAQQILNQYNPGLLQNQTISGQLANQAAAQAVPYAGQLAQNQAALAGSQAFATGQQGNLYGVQGQYYPASIKAQMLNSALRYGSPALKSGYSAAMISGQPNLGAVPVYNFSALSGGQPQGQDQTPQQLAAYAQSNPGVNLGGAQTTGQLQAPPVLNGPYPPSTAYPTGMQQDPITANTLNALNQQLQNPGSPQQNLKWQNASNLLQTTNMLKQYLSSIPNLGDYTGTTGELNYEKQALMPQNSPKDPGYYQVKVIKDTILPALSKQLQKYAVGSTNGNLLMQTEENLDPFGHNSNVTSVANSINSIQDVVNRESMTAAQGAGKMNEYHNLVQGNMADGSAPYLPMPEFNNQQDFNAWKANLTPAFAARYKQQLANNVAPPDVLNQGQ